MSGEAISLEQACDKVLEAHLLAAGDRQHEALICADMRLPFALSCLRKQGVGEDDIERAEFIGYEMFKNTMSELEDL